MDFFGHRIILLFLSIIFLHLDCSINAEKRQSIISQNMTSVLNSLVRKDLYDKRLRPNYGGPPVNVNITMHVYSLGHVSEVEMDYTVDIYLRQTWFDPRLTWQDIPVDEITINVEYMKSIWVPDTFFPNEKKAFFHTATTHNSFLRITKFGKILTSQRLTITANCPMFLHYFPLDSQVCALEIESYGYSTDDIRLQWSKVPGVEPVDVAKNCELPPTFHLEQPLIYIEREITLSTGSYSRLTCKFDLRRTLGFYWIQIYQPSILIVFVSWVTFWINRDSAPARVTLGIMTVLTMTTLMSTTNRQMPKVSYVKAVDVYLVVCYIMVFAALLEYAVVSYANKKKQDVNKRRQKVDTAPLALKSDAQTPQEVTPLQGIFDSQQKSKIMPIFSTNGLTFRHPSGATTSINPTAIPEDPRTNHHSSAIIDQSEFTRMNFSVSEKSIKKLKRRAPKLKSILFDDRVRKAAGSVDKYSRMIFPGVFTVFNLLYWLVYLKVSGKL